MKNKSPQIEMQVHRKLSVFVSGKERRVLEDRAAVQSESHSSLTRICALCYLPSNVKHLNTLIRAEKYLYILWPWVPEIRISILGKKRKKKGGKYHMLSEENWKGYWALSAIMQKHRD